VDVHTQVRVVLGVLRRDGTSFPAAWTRALMSLPRTGNEQERTDWTDALAATKRVWEHEYLNGHAPAHARAALLLLG